MAKKWSASNYRAQRSKRLESITPEWVKNPDTGSEFYLRRVGAMASVLASYMNLVPTMADEVVSDWQKQGVDVGEPSLSLVTSESASQIDNNLRMMAKIIEEACVIPRLVPNPKNDDELNPAELDNRDAMFIYRYAIGEAGALKGGEVASVADLKSLPKKTRRSPGVRGDGAKLRDASEPVALAG